MVNPRYTLGEQIEIGAQGSVVNAIDTKTGQAIALKIFDITTEKGSTGFTTEVLAHQILQGKSKRICSVIECLQVPGHYGIIAMKKYEKDLFDLTINETVLPQDTLKKTFRGICKAVRDLHTNGIAHLDLKLENILLDKEGKVYLCDLGCSYSHSSPKSLFSRKNKIPKVLVKGIECRGTKKYAAPEVFLKENEYNPFSADIYSLGVMLHVLTTTYYPGKHDLDFASQQLDAECFSLLRGMLQKNPTSRMNIHEILSHPWLANKNRLQTWKEKLTSL